MSLRCNFVVCFLMKRIILFLFLFQINFCYGQTITGVVYDKEDKTPLQGVTIIDKKTKKWVITDRKGIFSIALKEDFELIFSLLGKEDFVLTPNNYTEGMSIFLSEKTLRLTDVVVVGTQQNTDKTSSAVVLDKYAISQFQSFSLSDILQQLPGQIITKPSFHSPNTLTMRTAIDGKQNAFGVGFILDDMPLSNDENMQTYNKGISATSFSNNVNGGFDLRAIPSSSIEKVEIITGVPDVKYGNVTTGVVVIERKVGVYPLQVSASMLGGGNSVSMNKGFKLPKRAGNLSLSIDYLNANADPRNNLSSYNRITGSSIWSYFSDDNRFKNTLSFTFRSNIDGKKTDKEQMPGYRDSSEKKEIGGVISNRLNRQFTDQWIDQLSITAGISYSKTDDYNETFVNNGGKVVPIAIETDLKSGFYTPVTYTSIRHTKGVPLNINSSASVRKNIEYERVSHFLSAGLSFNYSDNLGEGIVFDSSSASSYGTLSVNSSDSQGGIRSLNFDRYVIASKLLSVYAQDNIDLAFQNKHSLNANIGFRYENLNGYSSFSPRINTAYVFSPQAKIRVAMGLTTKSPSLSNIFPGDVFFDILLKDVRTNDYAFNLVQTFVEKRPRVDLKPSKLWKYELGVDACLSFATLNFTAYLNKMYDGFTSASIFKLYPLPVVDVIPPANANEQPTYQINGYQNVIRSYSTTVNAQDGTDTGVDLIIRFKKINKINTQLSLMGSYVYSESSTNLPYIEKTKNGTQTEYVYGFYERNPSKQDRMSLRLTASHHIPSLGLLISLTAEQFVFATTYASVGNIYPYAYMNNQLQYREIPLQERSNTKYQDIILAPTASNTKRTPLYHNFHLRITKEMLSGLSMSVYATNFFNYRPEVVINGHTERKNTSISFGGSVKYTF